MALLQVRPRPRGITAMISATLRSVLAVSLALSPCLAQTPTPAPPERVIINFIAPVTTDTVNVLINIVNAQVRNGTKKITIVVSSSGGDPSAAFGAYNYLKNVQAEITTFNGGVVDSAAMFIFCAGKFRYSLPAPSRFLIHATALNPMTVSVPIEGRWIESQLAQLKNMDHMASQIIAANSKKKESEIDAAIQAQTILSPEDAKNWGLVQDIRTTYMEPGALLVGVTLPPEKEQKPPAPYSSGSSETVKN
jgi:ATP-dependent Clp protease protease subunit